MCTRLIASLVFAAATPLVAAAQVAATAPAPAPVAALSPQATPQPAPAPQPAQAPVVASTGSQNRGERAVQSKGVNVRIDAAVIESHGEQVTGRKVLSITLVDGEWGSVRSSQQVFNRTKGGNSFRSSPLNMDARAFLRDDGRIKVALTLEYRGVPPDQGPPAESPEALTVVAGALDEGIKQNVTVVLESGKPLIVAQSADAVGDRRVALEVKATVLK